MATAAFEDDETTNTAPDPGRKPEPLALGSDAAPTTVLLGAESDAAPTSMVLGSPNAVPWAEPAEIGKPSGLDAGPTDPGWERPSGKAQELFSGKPAETRPNNPAQPGKPGMPPIGFTALGSDIDPNQTRIQPQVSPLLVSLPRVSMRKRLARRLSVELGIPVGDEKGRARFYGIIALTALLAIGVMIGTFQIASWALSSHTRIEKKEAPPQVTGPTRKHK